MLFVESGSKFFLFWKMEPPKLQKFCRNCTFPLAENAKYCSKCSQKNTDGKVPVLEFIKEFFTNFFDVDSKLFLTFFAIFIPGKLTIEYFKGKHKSYASPVRLFLYAGITLFAFVISRTQNVDFGQDKGYYKKRVEQVKAKKLVKDNIKKFQTEYQDTSLHYQSDSLKSWIIKGIGKGIPDADSVQIGTFNNDDIQGTKIASNDFVNLTTDSLIIKYNIKGSFQRIIFSQQVKVLRDGKGLFHYFIGKLPIAIFFMMPFLAFILKVLYARKKNHYFVEHLVFSFHYHTFAFIITLVLVLFGAYFHGLLIAALIVSIFIYQLIAMKRYYRQGKFKTFLKFSILNFSYIFLVSIFFGLSVVISFILF